MPEPEGPAEKYYFRGREISMSKFKVRTQLLIMALVPLLVMGIVLLIVSYNSITSKALEDAEKANLLSCEHVEASFSGILTENLTAIKTVAKSAEVKAFLEGDSSLAERVLSLITAVDAEFNDGSIIAIANDTGMQQIRSKGDCVDVKEREYFQQAMAGNAFVSDVIVSKSTGARQITLCVPVMSSDNSRVIGTVQRNYSLNDLHDFLAEVVTDGFVVDKSGALAAHAQFEITDETEQDMSDAPFYTSGLEEGMFISDTGRGYEAMMAYVKEPISGFIVVNGVNTNEATAHARTSAIAISVIGAVLILLSVAVVLFMSTSFLRPINAINSSLSEFAEGRFVEITGFDGRKDEFGRIVDNTNSVLSHVKGVVSDLKDVMRSLGESSESLAETAGQISQTTDDVSEAVQDIAKGATEQADTIQRATENIGSLSDAIQNVANNAQGLASTASSMNDSSTSSADALRQLSNNMDAMSAAMQEITEGMNATNAAVHAVNERVDGITSIASQTNLLALNASIEAARAGEAGRGFAVVAEEIGKLATESAQTAEEIRNEMSKLLDQSQNAITKTGEVTEISNNVNGVLQNTVDTINELITGVGSTVDGVSTISGLSEESAASKTIIVDAMDSLSAISEENAASTEETSASMEELNATVNVLSQSASDLNDLAKKLEEDLDFFKI